MNSSGEIKENLDRNVKNIEEENIKRFQEAINQLKLEHEPIYKIKVEIIEDTKEHTDEEKDFLIKINNKFNKSYTHKDKYINICNFKENFGDKYFNFFSKVGWECLIELNLINNNISKIEPLYAINLLNLEKLDLSYNYISDIEDLEQIHSIHLKSINLKNNKIDNPFVFMHSKFINLDTLNLENNDIEKNEKRIFIKKYNAFYYLYFLYLMIITCK